MGMSTREALRQQFELAAQAMSRAIVELRELGHAQAADRLTQVHDDWVRQAARELRALGPAGRVVVPPIVPASYSLKPPVRVRQPAPALRVVEVEPLGSVIARMEADAERQVRASRDLLEQCRNEREVPDAG